MSKAAKRSQKSRKLFRAIGNIDDRMIINADAPKKKRKKQSAGYRWFYGLAACVVAVVSVGVVYRTSLSGSFTSSSTSSGEPHYSSIQPPSSSQSSISSSSETPSVDNLPMITPGQVYEFGGGGIFEGDIPGGISYSGLTLADISDLKNTNPWTEDAKLTTLPVFHNVYASTTRYSPDVLEKKKLPLLEGKRATVEEMESFARSIAENLGVTVETVKIEPTEERIAALREKLEGAGETLPEEDTLPTEVTLTCSGDITITTETNMDTRVRFHTPVQLPEEYKFSYYSSYEQVTASGEYLIREYENLLHMEKPVLDICGGEQNINGEIHYDCYVYEGAGDLTQQILNYNFSTAEFSSNEEGNLDYIFFRKSDLSEKLGDYPIYTAGEAQEKMEEQLAESSMTEIFANEGKIERIELTYKLGEITLMPYYNFYIETTPESHPFAQEIINNGHPTKTYVNFIIPAVREEYLNIS